MTIDIVITPENEFPPVFQGAPFHVKISEVNIFFFLDIFLYTQKDVLNYCICDLSVYCNLVSADKALI